MLITRVSIVAGVSVSEYTSTTLTFPSLPINVMSGIPLALTTLSVEVRQDRCIMTSVYLPVAASICAKASIVSPCPGVVEDEREPWPYIVTDCRLHL